MTAARATSARANEAFAVALALNGATGPDNARAVFTGKILGIAATTRGDAAFGVRVRGAVDAYLVYHAAALRAEEAAEQHAAGVR